MFTIKEYRQLVNVVGTKMERFGSIYHGGMVGEDDTIRLDGQIDLCLFLMEFLCKIEKNELKIYSFYDYTG